MYEFWDMRCMCCHERLASSAGCLRCTSSRTYCGCGALLVCGCGKRTENHECPRVLSASMTFEVNVF
jgi:hypothetical protein